VHYDVIIAGAGIIGGAIARELSKCELSVLAIEKEADVSCGISKANTGIIHSPALVKKDTRKAEYTIRGNLMMDSLCKEMGVVIQRPGALVLAYSEEDRAVLESYKEQGQKTRDQFSAGDGKYKIIERDEILKIEPSVSEDVVCALMAPDAGRIIPYELAIALWENAVENGVDLRLEEKVLSVEKNVSESGSDPGWDITTDKCSYSCSYFINSTGHGSNDLGMMAGFEDS
jgi:glycerol-3-phosphate dehydrogenase